MTRGCYNVQLDAARAVLVFLEFLAGEAAHQGCFSRTAAAGHFEHKFSGLLPTAKDGYGDMAALDRGEVAITPIRFSLDVEPVEADRRRFERSS